MSGIVTRADAAFMQRALELAERGLYTTTPNPRVGCVLVRDGIIIGEGWHVRAGEPHAEPNAIADARRRGHDTRGATAYVTLEPCNHTGRTGPCTEALRDAGVTSVVVGMRDPNPMVLGGGAQALEGWGIPVTFAEPDSVTPRVVLTWLGTTAF
jgi:diaminohydroxyphosphoribosylaminopyrimidine deaminase/5-amino-6-(5-phosphoribosylamino)uracil reductase